MDVFVIIGNANTRKSSVVRSLTGCFTRSLRDIQPAAGGPPRRVYARARALQFTRTRPADFAAEASATRCDTVLVCLTPDANPLDPARLPDAETYLAQFRAVGWKLKSIAVLDRTMAACARPACNDFPRRRRSRSTSRRRRCGRTSGGADAAAAQPMNGADRTEQRYRRTVHRMVEIGAVAFVRSASSS